MQRLLDVAAVQPNARRQPSCDRNDFFSRRTINLLHRCFPSLWAWEFTTSGPDWEADIRHPSGCQSIYEIGGLRGLIPRWKVTINRDPTNDFRGGILGGPWRKTVDGKPQR
jgi:hypothetical protein